MAIPAPDGGTLRDINPLDPTMCGLFDGLLSWRRPPTFYASWDVFTCFEMARDSAKLIRFPSGRYAALVQRFQTSPRFRLYDLNAQPDEMLGYAEQVAFYSHRPVKILNVDPHFFPVYDPLTTLHLSDEALLEVAALYERPQDFFSKREMEMLRRDQREMDYRLIENGIAELQKKQVLDEWKRKNAEKHFRLSITRDYVAAGLKGRPPTGIQFLGFRNKVPGCLHIFSRVPQPVSQVTQMVEKSLNYRDQAGGRPGTTNANLWFACSHLRERGIETINMGTFDGGNAGLGERKKRLAARMIQSGTVECLFKHGGAYGL
jgi:hypothetical protein